MRTLVLASTSVRRKELLTFLGVPFTVVASDFPEETIRPIEFDDPSEYVATLATGKALAVVPQHDDAIVIGADTIVFVDGQYLGKPKNLDDARRMLLLLRGKRHDVYTGVFMIDTLTNEHQLEVVQTGVTFSPFSDEALEQYISTSESLGKAGSYAIQAGAKTFVQSIEGSLSNVVGLPLRETADMLERLNIPIAVDVDSIIEEHFTHKQ